MESLNKKENKVEERHCIILKGGKMKNNILKKVEAIISDACEALPGANNLIRDSRTRAATALKTVLVTAITYAYEKSKKDIYVHDVDPVALARETIFHPDFANALDVIPDVIKDINNLWQDITLAGIPISNKSIGKVKNIGSYKLSYAEDLLVYYTDMIPCPERIKDIIDLYHYQITEHLPEIDADLIRYEADSQGKSFIVFQGWNEKCIQEELRDEITGSYFAHKPLNYVANRINFEISQQIERKKIATEVAKNAADIERKITEAIERIAPELNLEYRGIEILHGQCKYKTKIIYEGTTFDFQTGEVVSIMSKDRNNCVTTDHYVKHVLPSLVQGQRLLNKRMSAEDATNVLVEGPLVRHMMEIFGADWVKEARAICAIPTGKKFTSAGWNARLSQGVLRGSIDLSPEVKWSKGSLHVNCVVPESVITDLPGKLLSEVVEHRFFGPETKILSASNTKRHHWNYNANKSEYNSVLLLRTNIPDLRLNDFYA